ncbi:MAG: PAS domain S-box protein [Pseudomonadota bacterium]
MFSRETQALMDATVDAVIVIDHRGRITAINDATHQTFGYRTDELLGANVSILMPEPHRAEHDAYLARYLESGVAKIIGIGREVIAQRKDGSLFRVRLAVGKIEQSDPPRFVGLVRNITCEYEAMANLKLERDRANAFLELHESILLELDSSRRIRQINSRGCDLLGAPVEDLLGRDWLDFAHGDGEQERARLLLASALSSGSSREREFDALDAAGQQRRIHWRSIALRTADDAAAGWLCSGTDVTDWARREEDAHLAQERLTRVARLATMGEMAAGIAHELNQPLTAITTYARACDRYLAMPQPDFAELTEAVREIGAEGLRAGEIIQRLRQLVRSDDLGEVALVDVNFIIEELKVLLLADARVHDTRLHFSLTPDLPRIDVNSVQIQQVLLNLVRNALEALAAVLPGFREITVATEHTAAGEIEIRVADNGPGVSPTIADRLFHPFATTKKTGTGLGLAISRTIMQAHGGTIGTRPVSPQGACFYLRLPVTGNGAP